MKNRTSRLLLTAAIGVALAGCSTADKNMVPPAKPAPVAAPAPAPAPKVMVKQPEPAPAYIIEDVHFDFDKATLKPSATQKLDEVVDGLKTQPGVAYEVAGHTDSIGSETYNQGLSERRAGTVHDYLLRQGIDGNRLTARGYGETRPQASNATKQGRASNRRVEVRPR